MGLLDELLAGLAGQGMGGRAQAQRTRAGGGGAGMSQVLVALMPIVLGMAANRGARGGAPAQVNYAPGGGMAGGLGGLLQHLQRQGFGEQADSWVSRGANQPISPDAMSQIFARTDSRRSRGRRGSARKKHRRASRSCSPRSSTG